jgi:hypothetical protein
LRYRANTRDQLHKAKVTMNMKFSHKGYKCTISYQSHYFAAAVHVSSIKEEKAFREYAESRLSEVLIDLTVEEVKIQFIYLVERFLRSYEVEYPLYPKPELPNAKIDVTESEGIYLVPDNYGVYRTSKFRVFPEASLRVLPLHTLIPVGNKPKRNRKPVKRAA